MPIELPADLTPELVPLYWLLGRWEGVGVLGYGDVEQQQFAQEVNFTHDGMPYLKYDAQSWLIDDDGNKVRPLSWESGVWQLDRELYEADGGPGMIPSEIVPALTSAEDVEKYRNKDDGFNIIANVLHPGGISELYVGQVKGPRIDLSTDAVMRAPGSKDYRAATRMYGLVDGDLLWAWDIAAMGRELESHASARLKKSA
ncbi:FABP family protein [Arthrobacter castelli]|uniref:FABP family protein n=1 Tax=Arthrobacter castelli TaxID=271431 RepID=UPI000409E05B|nr:FABP family protein [Arthrobacter castelli]